MYQNDNLQAFGGQPILIEIEDSEELEFTEAWAVINNGVIIKKYEEPTFPLEVELTEEDTAKLKLHNVLNLIVFDEEHRPKTCDGTYEFDCNRGVIHESYLQS